MSCSWVRHRRHCVASPRCSTACDVRALGDVELLPRNNAAFSRCAPVAPPDTIVDHCSLVGAVLLSGRCRATAAHTTCQCSHMKVLRMQRQLPHSRRSLVRPPLAHILCDMHQRRRS